jgi:hypothetical protein
MNASQNEKIMLQTKPRLSKDPNVSKEGRFLNPAGPGDYNLPSIFKGLDPEIISAYSSKTLNERKRSFHSNAVKNNPSFTIKNHESNKRVFAHDMKDFLMRDTPDAGEYSPMKGTITDKIQQQSIRNFKNDMMK